MWHTLMLSFLAVTEQAPLNMLRISRGRQRCIYIANHYHPVGFVFEAHFFESNHGIAYLFGVGAGTDAEVDVGFGYAEGLEESTRHAVVVVLAGVDQKMFEGLRVRRFEGLQVVSWVPAQLLPCFGVVAY